jgi:hypothetical protein
MRYTCKVLENIMLKSIMLESIMLEIQHKVMAEVENGDKRYRKVFGELAR